MSGQSRKPLFVRDGRHHWTPGRWQGWLLVFSPVLVVLAGAAVTVSVVNTRPGGHWFVHDGPHHWSPATWQGWLLTLGPGIVALLVAAVIVVVVIGRYRRR